MTPSQRIRAIHNLQQKIKSNKRRHGPVKDSFRRLVKLVAQQIRREIRQERKEQSQ